MMSMNIKDTFEEQVSKSFGAHKPLHGKPSTKDNPYSKDYHSIHRFRESVSESKRSHKRDLTNRSIKSDTFTFNGK